MSLFSSSHGRDPADGGEGRRSLTDARVHELLVRLRLHIHYADATQREIEEQAGFSSGYLSQLLHGHIDLKMGHLLAVIDALEVDPAEFFADLFDERHFAARSLLALDRRGGGRNTPLGLELARLYGLGLESLDELLQRLERCEAAFRELEERGVLAFGDERQGDERKGDASRPSKVSAFRLPEQRPILDPEDEDPAAYS